MKFHIVQGDITTFCGDAIVNAANVRMLGGHGVDGAIHKAAGPKLKEACKAYPEVLPGVRCPTGEARITKGFNLQASNVIHTVGPMWFDSPTCRSVHWQGEGNQEGEPRELLAKSIQSCMELAKRYGLRTIAFPAISCGVFGGDLSTFAKVAHEVFAGSDWSPVEEVTFYLFLEWEFRTFKYVWEEVLT